MRVVIVVILFFDGMFSVTLPPNVCKNFLDYYTMDPRNCWHNPDVYLDPSDIVRRHGYPLEKYEVETEDHYFLDIFRMPKSNPKGVVLLESPAFSTYCGWIDKGKNDSLGFLLWDAGYDVWLGNLRGTTFGRKHRFLNPNEKPFWNFSFHEIGKYDLPAQVDLIVEKTNLQPGGLSIISFSLGSTVNVVYSVTRPEHSGKWVNVFALMAPSVLFNHIETIAKLYTKYTIGFLENIMTTFNGEILANNRILHFILSFCTRAPVMTFCMINDLFIMGNFAEEQPAQWIPIKFSQNPSGCSIKIFHHYFQMVNAGRFQLYDYGRTKNLEYYGTESPPPYPVQDIQTPLLLISADHDPLCTTADTYDFYTMLPKRAQIFKPIVIKNFSHSAFYYGTHAATKVYRPIIKLLDGIFEKRKT